MNLLFERLDQRKITLFFCSLLLFSLIFSRFLLSVSMIGLILNVLVKLEFKPKFSIQLHPDIGNNFRYFLANKAYLSITLVFLIVLFSGLYSEDFGYWIERLRIKLPFLILPFVFASIPSFTKKEINHLICIMLLFSVLSAIGVGINYLMNFEEINTVIKIGQVIPTPTHHVRYSLILALSIIGAWHLIKENFVIKYDWERNVQIGIGIFLFFFLHVLSVRSGLAVIYISIFILIILETIKIGKLMRGFVFLLGLVLIPIIAIRVIPSLNLKWHYVSYDLHHMIYDEDFNNSDSGRILSLKIGWELFQRNILFGIGAGDIKQEADKIYVDRFPEVKKQMRPHNQYLTVLAGTGLVGFAFFMASIFYPLYYNSNYKNSFFSIFILIALMSFMVENTIESSNGVGLYLFFLLLFVNHLDNKSEQLNLS